MDPNPHIDRIWTIDREVDEVLPELRKEKFTHIIDLHRNLRSLRAKLGLPRTKKMTYPKGTWTKYKRIYFKTTPPKIHVVDRYLKPLHKLGVSNDRRGLDFFIPADTSVDWNTLNIEPGQYIAFVIGAAHFTKRLPRSKIVSICDRVSNPVVLIGGPDVQSDGSSIADQFDHVTNLSGKTSFMESARIIEHAKAVISHDTGFMHIAAALRKPLISIWGSTDPHLGFWPYFGDHEPQLNEVQEVRGLSCRPCSKFGRASCPKGHFKCMNDIDVDKIVSMVSADHK